MQATRSRWQWLADNLDAPAAGMPGQQSSQRDGPLRVFDVLQDGTQRVSWKKEVREPLLKLFAGRAFEPVSRELEAIHRSVLKSRVFVALHMQPAAQVKVLTSCPSCLQGLSRYDNDSGTTADYIVVEMARHLLGPDWMRQYVDKASRGGIERVLL